MKKSIHVKQDAGNVEAGVEAFNGMLGEDITADQNRAQIIAELQAKGYDYNFERFSDEQLWAINQKQPAKAKRKVATPSTNSEGNPGKKCKVCGTVLTDGGYCPVCDDDEEHLNDNYVRNKLEENMDEKFVISYEKLPVIHRSPVRIIGEYPGYPDWEETNDEIDFELELSDDEVIETILEIDPDLSESEVEANIQQMFQDNYQRIKSMWEHDAIKLAQSKYEEAPEQTEWDLYNEDFDVPKFKEVATKSVLDSDGFYTDYTWYKDEDGLNVFIFGDRDIYRPETSEPDWEEENDEVAAQWFATYVGFEDELVEATDIGVRRTPENSDSLYHREYKGDSADNVMDFYVKGKVVPKHDGRYVVYDKLGSDAKLFVNFDIDGPVTEYRFTVDGVEHVCNNSIEAAKIINDALHAKRFSTFDIPMDEAWERDYNLDEWNEDDIELHKSIDWKARNYRDYPVPEDSIEATAYAYGLPGGTQRKKVKFIKHLRANELFPPYYRVEEIPFEGVLSGMYDGDKHGKYMIMNRFETQEVYDALSESLEESSTEDFKEGDSVYVKPSKKSGRVVSVKGDVVEVEIAGGKDPDRRDRFYASDLEKESSLTESADAYEKTARKVLSYVKEHPDRDYDDLEELLDDLNAAGVFYIPKMAPGFKAADGSNITEEEAAKYIQLVIAKTDLKNRIKKQLDEAIEMTADEVKAKHGTDNPDIINAGKPEEERVALKEDAHLYYHSASDNRKIPVFIKEIEPGKFKWEDESGQSDDWFETEEMAHEDFVSFIQNEIPDVVIEESLTEAMTYTDTNGFLGEPGEKYTMSQFRRMWQDKDNDPSMSAFDSFEEWVGETISHMDAHEEADVAPSGRGKLSCATFTDKSGIMGTVGEKYTVIDLADYWTANSGSDPVLAAYNGDWKKWLDDTIEQMEVSYDSCLFDESLHEDASDPRSWSDDKELTYEDALALAKAYYAEGGDGFYETADKDYFDYLVKEYGPQTVKMMKQSFGTFDAVAKDRMSQ